MLRQIIPASFLAVCAIGLMLLSSDKVNAQSDYLHRITCDQSDGLVVIRFGMTKRPTDFGVETPEGNFLYLVDPAKGIDHLGNSYKKDTVALKIDSLQGTRFDHGKRSDKRVFNAPGEYTLRFQDANRTEYEDLHAISCGITISERSATTNPMQHSNKVCAAGQSVATGLIADESGLPLEARMVIGCQPASGCDGSGGCCTRHYPGQLCYCNTCCIAKPSGISTGIASTGSAQH